MYQHPLAPHQRHAIGGREAMATQNSTIGVYSGIEITAHDLERFMRYVEQSCGCWLWTGAADRRVGSRDTYGRFRIAGQTVRAHRFLYSVVVGAIPQGLCVRHACDTPACVNPQHLLVGTHAENMSDMARRGRANGRLRGIQVCVSGRHPLAGDNLKVTQEGRRLCRACRKETERRDNAAMSLRRASKPAHSERVCLFCATSFRQSNHAGAPAKYCSRKCRENHGRQTKKRSTGSHS